ncbi:sensor histidine kinase [Ferruginivarius sediminum]|nr:ATP-binding protein [Ferruginivarius sediminum]
MRSVRASFLAINVPLVLMAMMALFGVFEYTAHKQAMEDLHLKLRRIASNQSAVLAESVWNLDHERVKLILAATADDPDIRGIAVYDDMGNLIGAVGTFDKSRMPGLIAERDIVFSTREQVEVIGRLIVALTDARVTAGTHHRVLLAGALAVLLLMSVVVSALIANRWTIGIPLQRLLDSIDRTESGGVRHPVQWDSHDEIGAVARAFNRMQARQQRYETELRQARDNLERRVAERTAELARARDAAEAANKAKTGFLANMSHELRTPLNAVIGFAEVLEGEVLGPMAQPRYKDYAKDIAESGRHLLSLINDLLDLSKAEAGKLELDEGEVDLAEAVEQSLAMVQPRAEAAGVSLHRGVPEELPGLYADERKIKQVLLNLLTNAIKFTPAGGEVGALIEWDGTHLRFSVTDTGIGIAREDLEKVMQPFAQVDSSLNRKYEGTGLGLPLVKSLVELHGGELNIHSEPGRGTRVVVQLPFERVRRPATAARQAS